MSALKEEFDRCLAGIAWNCWRELGVAGTERFYENCLIQPEELIILTSIIAKSDPRLSDEALDWCSRYHENISVSRLRTFLKGMDNDTLGSYYQFAANVNSISSAKWPVEEQSTQTAPKVSGKSCLPSLESPSLLMLRLRNLFGTGAKADILTQFLTKNGMHFSASDLIEIGYSKRSLMTALDQLAKSGILVVTNVRNKKNYELRRPRELQVLIGKLPKTAPPWIKILKATLAIQKTLPEIQNSSTMTRGVVFRNCLIKIEPLLPYFISSILQAKPNFERDWKAAMDIFKAFQMGNFFNQFEVYDYFEKVVIQLMFKLYQVDDCIDGIEMIQSKIQPGNARHKEVYKECYQLFLTFVGDLKASLRQFLEFPFHKLMDEALAEISYSYSKDKLPKLFETIEKILPVDQITNAYLALRQYQLFMPELDDLGQFIYSFRKRLEDLYFVNTNVHLISTPSSLYKRNLVLDLFEPDSHCAP